MQESADLQAGKVPAPQIIRISELTGERLEDGPVPIAGSCAVGLFQMLTQIDLDPIIVEERVVDVKQEDNAM